MADALTHELADRWVAGWAVWRERPATRDGSGWSVDLASESRAIEYVTVDPDAAEAERLVAAAIARPDIWATVIGELRPDAVAAFAALTAFEHAESLMTAKLAAEPLPAGVLLEVGGDVAFARIERDGVVAASGQAALSGSDAVVDRIETHPEFRRQGLGRLLMAGLGGWAAENGAETGILLASQQGRALYRSLGWRGAAAVVTFRG